MDQTAIDQIKSEAQRMTTASAKLTNLYKRYKEAYFMTARDTPKGNKTDENDWKVTVSPSARNAVTGMKRLLDTSEVHITMKVDGEKAEMSDAIEKGLKTILNYSGMYRQARIEKDLNLSAVLYGPAVLAAESVADLLKVQKKPAYRKRLEKIAAYTPFLLKPINPEQSFSKWGETGQLAHLRKYRVSGDIAEERWGLTGLAKNQSYTVQDWLDLDDRLVWIDGRKEVVLAAPHGMPGLNISARLAGGSSLFDEPSESMQSFLYAHIKGEWDQRENLFFTYLFTALYMQGLPGPLIGIDPESNPTGEVNIDFRTGVRTIIGKITPVNFPVVSNDVLQIKQILDATNNESTIYKQTLGQNISGSTFSGLAMLSSAGQLPLEDPKEAISYCYRDIFCHMLERIKYEGMENKVIQPEWIPDEYELEVTLEPKLPQDNLRNAQTAQSLGDLVSDEWKHTNLLQVGDTKAMRKQVVKEQLLKGLIGAMMQDQTMVQELINTALGRRQQPPQAGPGQTPPTPPTPPTAEQVPPEMLQQGQPNVEAMPMTGPGPMPQEMMMG